MAEIPARAASRYGVTIERSSTVRAVANSLRDAILSGRIATGTALREVPLAAEMGVSRNTVREAARLLEGEGLVRHELNRSVVVANLSDDDVDDLYAARAAAELAGVDALLRSRDAAVHDELARLVDQMETAAAAGDLAASLDGDRRFHITLVSATGSTRLQRWHASLLQELRLALTLAERSRVALGRHGDDHRALLAAIGGGSRTAARDALRRHLDAGAAELHRLRELVSDNEDLSTRKGR